MPPRPTTITSKDGTRSVGCHRLPVLSRSLLRQRLRRADLRNGLVLISSSWSSALHRFRWRCCCAASWAAWHSAGWLLPTGCRPRRIPFASSPRSKPASACSASDPARAAGTSSRPMSRLVGYGYGGVLLRAPGVRARADAADHADGRDAARRSRAGWIAPGRRGVARPALHGQPRRRRHRHGARRLLPAARLRHGRRQRASRCHRTSSSPWPRGCMRQAPASHVYAYAPDAPAHPMHPDAPAAPLAPVLSSPPRFPASPRSAPRSSGPASSRCCSAPASTPSR